MGLNGGIILLSNLVKQLRCNCKLNKTEKENLLKKVGFHPKKIKIISDLIDKGYIYNDIVKYLESMKLYKQKEINKIEQLTIDIYKIYFLLSFMPYGLPDSLIKLIFQDYDKIIAKEYKNNRLIFKDPDNNWNYLNDLKKEINDFFIDKKDEKNEILSKCLEVFANLLFFYIKKNKNDICFPDNNIHYIFNSYNGKGIWKIFDFSKKNNNYFYIDYAKEEEYIKILNYEFDLERIKENIINLIMNNLGTLKELLKDEVKKEYMKQILILLPSCYFLKKECKGILLKCKYLCEEKQLSLDYDEKRLLLFLNSLEPYQEEELNNIGYPDLRLEAKFLQFLKKKEKVLFDQIQKEYKEIIKGKNKGKEDIREAKLKLALCYYEMAGFYYLESKNEDEGLCYLKKAKEYANEINDYFLVDRINIDLFSVSKKIKEKNKENKNNKELEFLNEVLHQKKYGCQCDKIIHSSIMNEKIHLKKHICPYLKLQSNIINEAYTLKIMEIEKLEPDILLLNSNPLKNYFSVLNSGIFAYHNNQYYLLKQIKKKIRMNLKIESYLLNKENFQMALDKKGKILIVQSDDFTEKGEIILETDKGESELLSIEDLKKSNLLPEKIKFDILILCFIKSEKLRQIFEGKVNYLITFDNINCFDLDGEALLKYNKLSIDFTINFIGRVTQFSEMNENTIKESFENAKEMFINELKDYHLKTEFIKLTNTTQMKFVKNKNRGKIILNNPLFNLPQNI